MKLIIIFTLVFLPGLYVSAQTKNNVAIQIGVSNTSINTTGYIIDNSSQKDYYHIKAGTLYQLSYSRTLTKVLSLEGSVIYSHNTGQVTDYNYGVTSVIQTAAINMLSLPVYAKFTFIKYLFVYGGLSVDAQLNDNPNNLLPAQSGLGAEAGTGAKYNIKNIVLLINGFVRYHGTFSLASNSNNKLVDNGIKFGIGYTF